jgi:hypothetical protein
MRILPRTDKDVVRQFSNPRPSGAPFAEPLITIEICSRILSAPTDFHRPGTVRIFEQLIAGAVAGAQFGAQGLPDRWLSMVGERDELVDLAGKFGELANA